jgi:hypothetical protein
MKNDPVSHGISSIHIWSSGFKMKSYNTVLLFNISFDNMSRCCECDPAEQKHGDDTSDTIDAENRR